MYEYTLYNDDCVLHTESNTIIYQGEDGGIYMKNGNLKTPKKILIKN